MSDIDIDTDAVLCHCHQSTDGGGGLSCRPGHRGDTLVLSHRSHVYRGVEDVTTIIILYCMAASSPLYTCLVMVSATWNGPLS